MGFGGNTWWYWTDALAYLPVLYWYLVAPVCTSVHVVSDATCTNASLMLTFELMGGLSSAARGVMWGPETISHVDSLLLHPRERGGICGSTVLPVWRSDVTTESCFDSLPVWCFSFFSNLRLHFTSYFWKQSQSSALSTPSGTLGY